MGNFKSPSKIKHGNKYLKKCIHGKSVQFSNNKFKKHRESSYLSIPIAHESICMLKYKESRLQECIYFTQFTLQLIHSKLTKNIVLSTICI